MKLSQIFGMPAISGDNKKRSYVLGVSCVDGQIDGYICCDEREYEFFAADCDVKFSDGCMTVFKRGKEKKESRRLRLNRPVYDGLGNFVGNLEECTLKGGKISSVKVGKRKLLLSDLTLGDVILLKGNAPQTAANCDGCVRLKAKDLMIDALICGKQENSGDFADGESTGG